MTGVVLIAIAIRPAIDHAIQLGRSHPPVLEQKLLDYLRVLDGLKVFLGRKTDSRFTLQQGSEVMVSAQTVMKQQDDVHALLMDINRVEGRIEDGFSSGAPDLL